MLCIYESGLGFSTRLKGFEAEMFRALWLFTMVTALKGIKKAARKDSFSISSEGNYLVASTETFLNSFIAFIRLRAALRARAPAALLPFST